MAPYSSEVSLSASLSTGRNKKYAYYHCFSPCDVRIKQEDAHSWFHYFLRSISLNESSYELLIEIIKHEFDKIDKQNGVGPKHREKLKNLEAKLLKIQELYIDGDLTKEEYQNHKKQLQNLISEVKDRQIQFSKKKEVFNLYKNGLKSMQNIENQYIKSDIDYKRRLIGSIFPEKFQFQQKKVRTADINPILHKIAQFNRVKHENKKKGQISEKRFVPVCSGSRTRTCDLRVMSPTSYLLLYPALWTAKIQNFSDIAIALRQSLPLHHA